MRHLSIDILRTAAIFMMVVVHFVENLSATYDAQDSGSHPLTPWWLPSGLAAPLFTLLTGASYAIWLSIQQQRGVSEDALNRRTVRRGLFLIGLGFAFNIFVWLPEDTFNWDVLTLIGTAMLVLAVVRHLPEPVALGIAFASAAVAPVLRSIADYPAYWQNYHFDYDFTLSDVLLGFLAVGYFPIFPWLLYPIVGFLVGRRVFAFQTAATAASRPGWRQLLAAGGLLAAAAVASSVVAAMQKGSVNEGWRPPGWTMFPASATYILGTLAAGFLLLAVLHVLVDTPDAPTAAGNRGEPRVRFSPAVTAFFNRTSRHSLSIYLLHHVVHIWPLWVYGFTQTGDPISSWQSVMPAWGSAILAVIFFAACYPLFDWLDRNNLPTAESLMRWICD